MSEQQQQQQQEFQECSEIHTIQIFREADMILEQPQQPPITAAAAATPSTGGMIICTSAVPYLDAELYEGKRYSADEGIGGDWAIEEAMEEDATIEAPPPAAERRGSDCSTLYSFYFETPLVHMAQPHQGMDDADDDDFTITSQDSESFHNTTDLRLDDLEDSTSFWETGLSADADAAPMVSQQRRQQQHPPRCTSPAHVSLHGEEQQAGFPVSSS